MRIFSADDTFATRQAAKWRRRWWGNDAVALPLPTPGLFASSHSITFGPWTRQVNPTGMSS